MKDQTKLSLEGAEGQGDALHEELLCQGVQRFPEESFQQLLLAGASPEEALEMLGYASDRSVLGDKPTLPEVHP